MMKHIKLASALALFLSLDFNSAFQTPSPQLRQTNVRKIWRQYATTLSPGNLEVTNEATNVNPQESEDDFNWFKAWYPLVPVEFLDNEKPHAFKLLGMDVVVWNDGPVEKSPLFGPRKERMKGAKKSNGNWRVFVDQCPHRKVPLSEGRIEDDGSLLCSYHGWRFNGKGETIDVPQISQTNEFDKIRANPKSQCNSFPVKIVDGVLWVWPDSSDDSRIEALLNDVPPSAVDQSQDDVDKERVFYGTWNFRELPYGHDYFIENVVDPAHVPVSHHNLVGSRYDDQSLQLKTLKPLDKKGFSIITSDGASTEYTAPSQVLIKAPFGEEGAAQYLELYSSPSRPGFSNHVGRIVVIKDEKNEMPKMLKQFTIPLPMWVNHIMASAFLHQDALFLHGQERSLAINGEYRSSSPDGKNDKYSKAILPISADKGVLKFRKWMSQFAGGYIPFKGDLTMPAPSNEVVFDVWNSHTKNCKYCLTALKNLKKARFATFFASALLATVRPKKLGVIGSTVSALALSGIGLLLTKLIGMFYSYEFSHADNH